MLGSVLRGHLAHYCKQGSTCSLECSRSQPQRCMWRTAFHEAGRGGKPKANPCAEPFPVSPVLASRGSPAGLGVCSGGEQQPSPWRAFQQNCFSRAPGSHVSLTTENLCCCRTCDNSAWRRAEIKDASSEQQPNNKNHVPLPCKAVFCKHGSSVWPQSVQHLCFCFLCGANCGLACPACPCLPRRELPKGFSHLQSDFCVWGNTTKGTVSLGASFTDG